MRDAVIGCKLADLDGLGNASKNLIGDACGMGAKLATAVYEMGCLPSIFAHGVRLPGLAPFESLSKVHEATSTAVQNAPGQQDRTVVGNSDPSNTEWYSSPETKKLYQMYGITPVLDAKQRKPNSPQNAGTNIANAALSNSTRAANLHLDIFSSLVNAHLTDQIKVSMQYLHLADMSPLSMLCKIIDNSPIKAFETGRALMTQLTQSKAF